MVDLLLVMTLGFLGSFGHCVGMCVPLMAAFSLAKVQDKPPTPWQQFIFHILLNMRRVLSYTQVGLAIPCGWLGCRRSLGHSLRHSHLSSCRSL
jgi:sulfite exporter TauE/SafE